MNIAFLLCVLLFQLLDGPTVTRNKPSIGPLEPRFLKSALSARGDCAGKYSLTVPISTGSWVICGLESTSDDRRVASLRPTTSSVDEYNERIEDFQLLRRLSRRAMVAVDVKTLHALQFVPPADAKGSGTVTAVTAHYAVDRETCAVVTTTFKIDKGTVPEPSEQWLWLWHLNRNEVSSCGRWDAPVMLRLFLDAQRVSIDTPLPGSNNARNVQMVDRQTGRQAAVAIRRPQLLQAAGAGFHGVRRHGDTVIPQQDKCSFVLYERPVIRTDDPDRESRLLCIDPRSPHGIRWSVGVRDLERAVGNKPVDTFYPVRGSLPNTGTLIVEAAVEVAGDRWLQELLVLDAANGHVGKIIPLPAKSDLGMLELQTSADASLSGYVVDEGPNLSRRQLIVIDMHSASVAAQMDVTGLVGIFDELFCLEDRTHFLARSGNTIYRLILSQPPRMEKLFTLDLPSR
jgi:hypothetical protein